MYFLSLVFCLRLTDLWDTTGKQVRVFLPSVWAVVFYYGRGLPLLIFTGRIRLMKKIGIVMGSASDLPVVRKAAETLAGFGVPCEVHVYSAHRTPAEASAFARSARDNGFAAIIAAAGMAAHLAGAIAANTTLPVIGIPLKSNALDGVDALLSTVQMPSGIPVATVAIDGAVNAALLAVQILAVDDAALAQKLEEHRKAGAEKALMANAQAEAEFNH